MVNVFDLEAHGVDTVGVLPQGLPAFTIPQVAWGDLPPLVLGALAIAVVALADTMSTASSFAARKGVRVEGNQEMIGIGAANIAAGAFQGFPVSTSGSRTAVAEQAGSRSQVTGVVGAVVIAVVLLFANSLMQYVPQPTLGAIVIAAAVSLTDVAGMRRLWLQRRTEFLLSLIALLGVALLGCPARHPRRGGPVHPQRVPPHLVAAPGRARPRGGDRGNARHRELSRRGAVARAGRLPVRRAP